MKNDSQKYLSEYEHFLKSDGAVVPAEVSTAAFSEIQKLLNPRASGVFLKILAIHLTIGTMSLGVCHQFGMNPFKTESSLDSWFMSMWGHHTCMVVCGALFIVLSILGAGGFLTLEEVKVLKQTEFAQSFALGLASLGLFSVFGADLVFTFASLWLFGALVGGFFATEAVWRFRRLA